MGPTPPGIAGAPARSEPGAGPAFADRSPVAGGPPAGPAAARASGPADRCGGGPRPPRWRWWAEWVAVVVVALVLALGVRDFVAEMFYIPSGSMLPTLQVGDRIVVDKLSYHLHAVHRGDMVVFRRPPLEQADYSDLVKRVIGLPGRHHRQHRSAGSYIDGKPLAEPWLPKPAAPDHLAEPRSSSAFSLNHPYTVPPGHYFVMGDNRTNSEDSRYFGPIARSDGGQDGLRGVAARRLGMAGGVGGGRRPAGGGHAGGGAAVPGPGPAPPRRSVAGSRRARYPLTRTNGRRDPGRDRATARLPAAAQDPAHGRRYTREVTFLSPAKLLVILVVALVVLGPDKLPKMAKQIGGLWGDFRRFRERLESDVRGNFPDLPSTETIAQAVRSPLTFLDTLADSHSDRERVRHPGRSPAPNHPTCRETAVQPSARPEPAGRDGAGLRGGAGGPRGADRGSRGHRPPGPLVRPGRPRRPRDELTRSARRASPDPSTR